MNFNKSEIEEIISEELKQAEKKYGKEFKITLLKILSYEKMLNPTTSEPKQKEPIPLADWEKYHKYPSVKALRNHYFNRATNGFDCCVTYGGANGGRILIDEDKFFKWQATRKKPILHSC